MNYKEEGDNMPELSLNKSAIESSARAAYCSIKKFYENEENQRLFNSWLEERRKNENKNALTN